MTQHAASGAPDQHLGDDQLETYVQTEWGSGAAAAARRHPDWSLHLIYCDRCAEELAAARRAYGLVRQPVRTTISPEVLQALADLGPVPVAPSEPVPVAQYVRDALGQITSAILWGATIFRSSSPGFAEAREKAIPERDHEPTLDEVRAALQGAGEPTGRLDPVVWVAGELNAQVVAQPRQGGAQTEVRVLTADAEPDDPYASFWPGWEVALAVEGQRYGPAIVPASGSVELPDLRYDAERLQAAQVMLTPDVPLEVAELDR